MAYINRLSDINNRLDVSIENQNSTNNKLTNIDDNIETIRTLNNNINNNLNNIYNNNAVNVNVVSGSASDGKAYLYNGDGTTALTSTGTSLDVNIKNTSIPVTGNFYQATQPISGTVGISNSFTLNTTTQSTNTKLDTIHTDLDGLTFDGSSNLNVNIASGSISGSSVNIKDSSGNNLNSTSNALNSYITNTSIPVTGNFYQATQPVSGTVSSQLKDGSGNNLNSTSNALNSYITNTSIPVTGTFYQATQPISGTIDISNSFTLDTTTQSTNTKLDTIHTDLNTTIHGDITSTNTKLDTIHTDLDGLTYDGSSNLNVNVAAGSITVSSVNIKDSSGNNLNSTSNALNSYITNASIPVTGTFYQATQPISGTVDSNLKDGSGNSITSTSNALDINVKSGSISVSSVNIKDSSGNNLNSTSNALNSYITNASIPVTGNFYQATQPVSGTIAITDSLGANILANSNSLQTVITNVSIPVTGYVDAFLKDGAGSSINSTSSALNTYITNTKTTNDYSASGLNVYQIYPKIKSYALCGFSNHNVADVMLAGQSNTLTVNSYVWGKINANKSYWLYTPTGANVRSISYNYINASGNEATGTATGIVNSYVALQSNIVCLNNFTITGGVTPISTDGLYITLAGSGTTTTAVASIVGTRLNTNNAIFTVPNNCIAMVTNIDGILSTANDYYFMNVWDADGNRTVPSASYMYITGVNNYKAAAGDNGCIGRILTAGETVAFTTSVTTAINRNVYANIKVVYL